MHRRSCLCVRILLGFSLFPVAAASATAVPVDEALTRIESEVRLPDVMALALERSPSLAEARARAQAGRHRQDQEGRLPDAQLKYEHWSVPLRRPWDVGAAYAIMLGVSQVFPAGRSSRQEAAAAAAEVIAINERTRRLDVAAQVRRAFAAYYQAHRQLELHRAHAELLSRLVELARAGYQSGTRSQQDVVRLGLEVSRVHGTLVHMQPELQSAQALLNALVNRPLHAPLGPPAELNVQQPAEDAQPKDDFRRRPELLAAKAQVRRSEATVAAARSQARTPSFMVGLDYMYMPMDPEMHHTYGAMLGMGLPWLNPGRAAEERAAAAELTAERQALEAAELAVRYEIRDAQLRWQSAWASYEVLERDVLLQAQRNLETARATYAAGQADASALVDAARTYLDVQIERVQALAHVEEAAADLARARAEEVLP